jgi:hypothetical protein
MTRETCARPRLLSSERMGKPVPKFCVAHEVGEPDCLMQLMMLTMCERLNIMMSIVMGEARDWFDDADHPYKRTRENRLRLRAPLGFGSSVGNVNVDAYDSILRYDGPIEKIPLLYPCGLCVKVLCPFRSPDFPSQCARAH